MRPDYAALYQNLSQQGKNEFVKDQSAEFAAAYAAGKNGDSPETYKRLVAGYYNRF